MSEPDSVDLFINATLDGAGSQAYHDLMFYAGWDEDQFDQFYDTSNPDSFGAAIVD